MAYGPLGDTTCSALCRRSGSPAGRRMRTTRPRRTVERKILEMPENIRGAHARMPRCDAWSFGKAHAHPPPPRCGKSISRLTAPSQPDQIGRSRRLRPVKQGTSHPLSRITRTRTGKGSHGEMTEQDNSEESVSSICGRTMSACTTTSGGARRSRG